MKLKFKNQEFQEAATAAVCDVFDGQPYHDPKINVYTVDPGRVVASSQLSVVSGEGSLPGFETLQQASEKDPVPMDGLRSSKSCPPPRSCCM